MPFVAPGHKSSTEALRSPQSKNAVAIVSAAMATAFHGWERSVASCKRCGRSDAGRHRTVAATEELPTTFFDWVRCR